MIVRECLPDSWTDPVERQAWAHAMAAYPAESLGVVWPDASYEALTNNAADPQQHAGLAAADLQRLAAAPGSILVHSHPDGPECPSAADMRTQLQWGMPFVVLPVRAGGALGKAFAWGHGTPMPLLGRPFRHGITDCYALVRDWFGAEWGLALDEVPRDWEWWHQRPSPDLYRTGYAAQGFSEIALTEAFTPGDVILYALRSAVPQHAAIVLDAQRILHHPAGARAYDPTRLSCIDLRATWQRFALMAVRPPSPRPGLFRAT